MREFVESLYDSYDDIIQEFPWAEVSEGVIKDGYEKLRLNESYIQKAISEIESNKNDISKNYYLNLKRSLVLQIHQGVKKSIFSTISNSKVRKDISVNDDFIASLKEKANELGISKIGFCHVPNSYIFAEQKVLYVNAIICIKEMEEGMVDKAPEEEASIATLSTYVDLGDAINKLCEWIREHEIPTQAVHPYKGYILLPTLAALANLGYRGKSGMLITPEFGPRQRIGAILTPILNLPFPQINEHKWIPDFCNSCNKCYNSCPGNAILNISQKYSDDVFVNCIDNKKCYPWFYINNGCSICLKVCPFSNNNYKLLMDKFFRKTKADKLFFRLAQIDEFDDVVNCIKLSFSPYTKVLGQTPAALKKDYQKSIRLKKVHVAEYNGAIVGTIVIDRNKDLVTVTSLSVLPKYRGKKIGLGLMQFSEDLSRKMGITKITLFTNVLLENNIFFFKKAGYIEMNRSIEEGYERVYFEKFLE